MVIHYFSSDAFAGNDHKLALYLKHCVCGLDYCFRYFHLNLVCNNYV
jgi:hypothetical protein